MNINKFSTANGKDSIVIDTFTNDQKKAYEGLIDFINSPYDEKDYKRALIGPAGTGKTYLVKALIKNCNLSYSTIGLAAPTHKACRVLHESIRIQNIKVNTLQSDLGLRLNFNVDNFDMNNPPFDPKGRIKIGNYKIYIVDEASMINKGLMMFLEKICKSNKCKILYIGDASQLPPVNEMYSSALRGLPSYTLTEIVRQDEDNPIRYLLDLLRFDIKHKTFKFLQYISKNREKFDSNYVQGYKVCNQKEFNEVVYNNFNDEQLTRNVDFCKVVAYTNPAVSSWNKYIRNAIIENANTSIITKNDLLISYTTIVNQFNEAVIKNSEEYIIKEIVNYTHPQYELKGFLIKFQAIHGGQITSPLFVLDSSDIFTMRKYVQISNKLIDNAKRASNKLKPQMWRDYYAFKESCMLLTDIQDSQGKVLFSRSIDYGFALTSHKSQGSTFDTVLVDVRDIVYNRFGQVYKDIEQVNRRLYVACSRCRNKLYLNF